MATFYIQLADKLLRVNGDVTKENISSALGYTPTNFSGNFNDLTNNPFQVDESGEFNIVDESGNVVARFDKDGLHTVEITAGSEHKLTEKADKIYVDDLVGALNFESLPNNPLLTDDSGELKISDESGNTITSINNNGVTSIEFTALHGDGTTHNLTEKLDRVEFDNNFTIDETGVFNIVDESGNVGFKVDNHGAIAAEFTANGHSLTQKADRTYVEDRIDSLDNSLAASGITHGVQIAISQIDGKISNLTVDDSNINFTKLQDNPVVYDNTTSFTIADENHNIGLKLNSNGLTVKDVIAGQHTLTSKASITDLNNKIATLDSEVSNAKDNKLVTVTVSQTDGKLSNVVVDDTAAKYELANLNNTFNNVINPDGTVGELTIADESEASFIGFKLNADGAKAKDFITSSNVSLNDVDERLGDIETLLQEDDDNVINNLKEVIDYFKDVQETETGVALLSTVATHTSNISTLSGNVNTVSSATETNKSKINDLTENAVFKEGDQTITGRKTFTLGPKFNVTGDTNAIAIGTDTRFNVLSGDTISDNTVLGMISDKPTLGHEDYETQVRGKKISIGSSKSKTTIQGSDTNLTYNGEALAFAKDAISNLKSLKLTYGISAGKTGTTVYDGTNETQIYIPTSIGHLNSNDTKEIQIQAIESAVTIVSTQGYAKTSDVNKKQDTISDLATIRSNASSGATAYGWGNHANAGYAKTSDVNKKQDAISDLTTIRNNASSGATAYGWGNHANAGYAKTSDVNKKQDTISDLATIRSNASSGATAYGWGDHSKKGYLTSSSLNGYATETWVTKYVTSAVTGGQVSLDGYATENWVNSKNYLTSSSLSGYAKTSDVNKKQDTISDLATIRSNASSGATAYGWGNHANAGYAKTSDVNKKQDAISDLTTIRNNASSGATAYGWGDHSKKGYLTSSSLNGYAKTSDVNKKQDAISDLATIRSNASSGATAYGWGDHSKKGYLTSSSLNGYATEDWVTEYVVSAVTGGQVSLDGYATENWVNSKNYLTSSSLSGYAKTSDVNKKQNAISDLATIRNNASSGATAYGWGDHSKKGYLTSSALSGYAKEDWVTSYVVSAVTGGQVSLDGYATEEYVTSKGYITAQEISNLATKSEVEALTADVVESEYVMATALNQIIVSAGFDVNGMSTLPSGETLTNAIKRLDNACANATEGLKYSTERVAYVTTFTYVSEDGGSENYEITTEQRNYNIETHRKAFNGEICTLNVSGMIYNYIYTMGNITNGSVIFATTDLLKRHIQIQANGNCLSFVEEIQVNLEGYATENWVNNKGYLTSSSLNGYAKTSDLASYLSKSGGQINGSLIINDESHNHITLTDDGEMYYDAKISYSDGTLGVYSGNRIDILSPISVKSKITVSNEYSGFTCTNLNADLLDGKHASEFMLKTDSVTGSVTYDDITDAPLVNNDDGEFHITDESNYKIATFNNDGLYTTRVTSINGFFQNSDETLKDFQNEVEVDFARLKNIPKVYYTWKDDPEKTLQIGTSAQKVNEVYPELTTTDVDSGRMVLDYAKLSIIALKAIDTLHEENKLLRKELEELKEKVNTKRTRRKKTE